MAEYQEWQLNGGRVGSGSKKASWYIPRLKKYQIMYEQQFGKQNKKEHDDTV